MEPYYSENNITFFKGDCANVLAWLARQGMLADAYLCDPPYGLEFMGRDWDYGIPGARFWKAHAAAAKPGANLMAFGGTRTHHRLMCAIEDAGWELRDVLMWLYGSGFPKSYDVSKGIDRAAGAERRVVRTPMGRTGNKFAHGLGDVRPWMYDAAENGYHEHAGPIPATEAAALWDGWGTGLKPAYEPIVLAMNPRDGTFVNNALAHGVAGLWIDGGRIPTEEDLNGGAYRYSGDGEKRNTTSYNFGRHGGEFVQPFWEAWRRIRTTQRPLASQRDFGTSARSAGGVS